MSIKKFDSRNNSNSDTTSDDDTVSGSEPYNRRHSIWKFVSTAAACLALTVGIAGGAVLIKNYKGGNSQLTDTSEPITAYIEEHEVFFRKGDQPDGEILLTSKNIYSAEPMILAGTDTTDYIVSVQFDQEGTAIFSKATAELAGTDIPISIWVDGECIFSPTVYTTITDGRFTISGDFTLERATEIADLLDPSRNVPDPYENSKYTEPMQKCVDMFLEKNTKSLVNADYFYFDSCGDEAPELFIEYVFTDSHGNTGHMTEIYCFNGKKYKKAAEVDDSIAAHRKSKDGLIFVSKPKNAGDDYIIYSLSTDGLEMLYDTDRSYSSEEKREIFTVNGKEITQEEWCELLEEYDVDHLEWFTDAEYFWPPENDS